MATREELGLKPGDTTTFITTTVEGNGIRMPVHPEPDASWQTAANYAGTSATIRHDATLMRVHYLEHDGTYGVVLDTTDPQMTVGEATRVDPKQKHYLGGEDNPTDRALHNAGVRVHHVFEIGADGQPKPGVQVESPWRTLGQYVNRNKTRAIQNPPPIT